MSQRRQIHSRQQVQPIVEMEEAKKREEERKARVAAEIQNTTVSTTRSFGRRTANWGNL